MYIDDGTAGDPGELKIDIDGHEYVEQENYSYEHNGVMDSVEVDTADGNHLVFTDFDHTGTADLVTEYDAHGDQVAQASYDDQSGKWIDGGPHGSTPADPPTSTEAGTGGGNGGTITVDTADGAHGVGPATADTNNDGRPDTAIVHDAQGDIILYTDTQGTGQADLATEITPDGHVVVAEHTGDHQWTEVEQGHLDSSGHYTSDGHASGHFTPQLGTPVDGSNDQHWGNDQAPSDGQPTGGSGEQTGASDQSEGDRPAGGQGGSSDQSEGGPAGQGEGQSGGQGGGTWAGSFSGPGAAAGGVVRIDASTGQWISQN